MKSEKPRRRRKAADGEQREPIAKESGRKEIVLGGLGVSAGIAIGVAHVVELGAVQIPEYDITAAEVEAELAR
ncbi:MAG TPA: hypothetical protein VGM87_16455, partial [Roseomonas sp.]